MRIAPPLTAFALAAGLVSVTTLTGQPTADKGKRTDPDLAALQGDWVMTKVEMPPGRDNNVPPAEFLKTVGVSIRGDLLTIQPPAEGGKTEPPLSARLVLNSGKSPRQADITPLDQKGQPRRRIAYSTAKGGKAIDYGPSPAVTAIYKLEGDTLVVAAPMGEESTRPTAFKAVPPRNPKSFLADDQGIGVVYLARKK